ncbi:hypothetical protein CHS0354_027199 [Potamilus streckersoni]|uniref:Uncharacterized protein n=1 Tax=Potamilus streckersoni TaxID=2493646 RepID=A0AAE0SYV6_9BIVA|nr:hypothetical protein CHS0354_027199 [Potamilus streckersoni]
MVSKTDTSAAEIAMVQQDKMKEDTLIPKLILTRQPDSRRSSTKSLQGEQLELRLLTVDEKYRSFLLYQQIQAFEDKVYQCYELFSVDTFYQMYVDLAKRTTIGPMKVKSMAKLRQCFKAETRRLRYKLRGMKSSATAEEENTSKYFTWFFQYFDYLRQLRDNFVDRIFNPLFRYFYDIGYDSPDKERTTDSALSNSNISISSFRRIDSRMSGISGLSTFLAEGQQDDVFLGNSDEDLRKERRRAITKHALLMLSAQFKDIKKLYDTSEIERLAQRLSCLKERIDYLLDSETIIDYKVLCQDSESSIFHLKIKEAPTQNLMRCVPDIILKFQKAAWLCRRWLEYDDEKAKDLNERLQRLCSVEEQMQKRLSTLSRQIQEQDFKLEREVSDLQKLLQREERASKLHQSMRDVESKRNDIQQQLNNLENERNELAKKMKDAADLNDRKTYKSLRPIYERNKFQRFALERQLKTLNFRQHLAQTDLDIELEEKLNVILHTNDVQDHCQELEETLENAKKEQKLIQAALIPITLDKQNLSNRLYVKENVSTATPTPCELAKFVGTNPSQPEYLPPKPIFNSKPLYVTSVPDGMMLRSDPGTPIKGLGPHTQGSTEFGLTAEW